MRRVTLSQFTPMGVQQALDRLASELGSDQAAAANVLVFRPGGQQSPGVYTTWPALVTAAQAVPGAKVVVIDASLAVAQVPAGVWDFGSQTAFVGASPATAGITELVFLAGARIRNVFDFRLLTLHCSVSADTEPVIITSDLPAGIPVFTLGIRTTVMADDGCLGGFLLHDRNGICLVNLLGDARIVANNNADAILRAGANGATLQIMGYDASSLDAFTVRTFQFALTLGIVIGPAAMISSSQHPWTFQLVRSALAANISYDDQAVAPQLGVDTGQAVIDALKASTGWFSPSKLRSGTGTPQGAVVGDVGDLYVDRSGGVGTTLYVKESGSGTNLGWAAK